MSDKERTDPHLERLKSAIRKVERLMELDRHDAPNYAPVLARLKLERDKYQNAIA